MLNTDRRKRFSLEYVHKMMILRFKDMANTLRPQSANFTILCYPFVFENRKADFSRSFPSRTTTIDQNQNFERALFFFFCLNRYFSLYKDIECEESDCQVLEIVDFTIVAEQGSVDGKVSVFFGVIKQNR